MNPKKYVPKSKAKSQSTSFGDVLKLGFKADELIKFVQENKNDAGYINIDIVPRREIDAYGNTHSCVLNDWKPNQTPAPRNAPPSKDGGQEIPF